MAESERKNWLGFGERFSYWYARIHLRRNIEWLSKSESFQTKNVGFVKVNLDWEKETAWEKVINLLKLGEKDEKGGNIEIFRWKKKREIQERNWISEEVIEKWKFQACLFWNMKSFKCWAWLRSCSTVFSCLVALVGNPTENSGIIK